VIPRQVPIRMAVPVPRAEPADIVKLGHPSFAAGSEPRRQKKPPNFSGLNDRRPSLQGPHAPLGTRGPAPMRHVDSGSKALLAASAGHDEAAN